MINKAKYLYYRGMIRSCNYTCSYCPFAKNRPSAKEIERDQLALNRFYEKVQATSFDQPVSIMLTPYGEALIYPHVQKAMAQLSVLPHVKNIGIQTNLSCDIQQLVTRWQQDEAKLSKIKLWCSFHPEMTSVDDFVHSILAVTEFVEVSVGVVGNPENLELIQALRQKLPPSIYLWINKMDGLRRHYTEEEIACFKEIDPFFEMELKEPRADSSCMGGRESFFIEANGKMFACNRSKGCMGNLYEAERIDVPCTRSTCDCYLAYANLTNLPMMQAFGETRSYRLLKKREFKAIFLDIDGTLTNKQGMITSESQMAVEYLAKKSKIYVVTALPYKIAINRCKSIEPFLEGGIFDNGMDIRAFRTSYKEQYYFDQETIEQLEKIEYFQGKMPIKPATKILLRILRRDMEKFSKQISHIPIEVGRERHYIYVTPKGCNKSEQTLKVCKMNGWEKQQVLVVGNSENDRDLVEAFPYAVVVPGSEEPIKEKATYCMKVSQIPMIIK